MTNTNVGEAKHKEVKWSALSTDGRSNGEHMWRCANDNLALKGLADGVRWRAIGWEGSKWVHRTVEAGESCQAALRGLFAILPLEPARSEDGSVLGERAATNPAGFVRWDVHLRPGWGGGGNVSLLPWQRKVAETVPTAPELLALYKTKLGCSRDEQTDEPCTSKTCASCWRNRAIGLTEGSVTCFNHWGGAAPEASAGTGTLRGGRVEEAARLGDSWMYSVSRANDVEIYVDQDAQRRGSRELGSTTLGRIAYFFEHQGNDLRRVEGTNVVYGGQWTMWVAVLEYATTARGNGREIDPATGCDIFKLRRTVKFFPAASIRSMVHMVHVCAYAGASPCSMVDKNGKRTWQCAFHDQSRYVLNKYFHSYGRGPIA